MLPELEVVFGRDDTMREITSLRYTTSYYIDTYAGGKSGNPVCLKSQKFILRTGQVHLFVHSFCFIAMVNSRHLNRISNTVC
jgi:hypothetical protein